MRTFTTREGKLHSDNLTRDIYPRNIIIIRIFAFFISGGSHAPDLSEKLQEWDSKTDMSDSRVRVLFLLSFNFLQIFKILFFEE